MRFRFQKVVNPKPKLVVVRETKSNHILPGEEIHSSRSLVSLAHLSRSLGQDFGTKSCSNQFLFLFFLKKDP
jgi:hypothetical protein